MRKKRRKERGRKRKKDRHGQTEADRQEERESRRKFHPDSVGWGKIIENRCD